MRKLLNKIKDNRVAKDTAWMLVGYLSKIGLQAVAFILLAKELGVKEFGLFSTSLAISSLIAPFIHLGAYNLVIENIVRKHPVSSAVGNNLLNSIIVVPVGLLMVMVVSIFLDIPVFISLNIGIAVFLGGLLITINRAVNISMGTLKYNSYLEVMLGGLQLLSVVILTITNGNIIIWSVYYCLSNLVTGSIALIWIAKRYNGINFSLTEVKGNFKSGFHFAVAGLANNGLVDVDKTMLTKFASVEATGVFSLAQKITNMAFVPMFSFLGAIYPKFVNLDEGGYSKSRKLAVKIIPIILAYCILIVSLIWIFAPLLIRFMGDGFEDAVSAIRILSFLILIQGLQYPFADALTGSGKQKIRTYGQVVVLIFNIILNLILIPMLGWMGAAWSSIISQMIFLIILYFSPFIIREK
ncbi:oligosaccharide flippase family protein [Bacillus cereus]|uniref:oligosaccharide flippase family protein n=1 Tax=Bacillus cereus TaxID=1396 RepID=UPI0035706E57